MSNYGDLLAISSDINASVLITSISDRSSYGTGGLQTGMTYYAYSLKGSNTKYILQHAASWKVSDGGPDPNQDNSTSASVLKSAVRSNSA